MCGKYFGNHVLGGNGEGSPPHVREILTLGTFVPPWNRITPACAGNTPRFPKIDCFLRDHPRMCGKYENGILPDQEREGSPPHVREIL